MLDVSPCDCCYVSQTLHGTWGPLVYCCETKVGILIGCSSMHDWLIAGKGLLHYGPPRNSSLLTCPMLFSLFPSLFPRFFSFPSANVMAANANWLQSSLQLHRKQQTLLVFFLNLHEILATSHIYLKKTRVDLFNLFLASKWPLKMS